VGADEIVDIAASFKVTEALAVVGPGRDGPEQVSGTPSFELADDSSAASYVAAVAAGVGTEVCRDDAVPAVNGSATLVVEYGGPALSPGMYYRCQATSWRMGSPIARTEDLRGVFVFVE